MLCLFHTPDFRIAAPVRATVAGGVDVEALRGSPLVTRVMLHDGRSTRVAREHAARSVRCIAPPRAVRYALTNVSNEQADAMHAADPSMPASEPAYEGFTTASVSVSIDDGQHYSLPLEYTYAHAVPSSLTPQGGPRDGGTMVVVHGSGFAALGDNAPRAGSVGARRGSGGVQCSFDGVGHVVGTLRGAHAILCVSPPVTNLSSYASVYGTYRLPGTKLRVSLTGDGEGGFSEEAVPFHYFRPSLVVSSATPSSGPASGGTLVTVLGSGFASVGVPSCRFGEAGRLPPVRAQLLVRSHGDSRTTIVNATVNASHVPTAGEYVDGLVCRSPPHPALRLTPRSRACLEEQWRPMDDSQCGSEEALPVEVSLNGGEESEFDHELGYGSGRVPTTAEFSTVGVSSSSPAATADLHRDYSSSRVPFTYIAYHVNPPDVSLAPPPPPPPPSPRPSVPSPSPPPPRPMDCNECHAGAVCNMCLVLIAPEDCPPSAEVLATLRRCDAVYIGMRQLCEGDGECGTDENAGNCGPGYDVYRRVPCYPYYLPDV